METIIEFLGKGKWTPIEFFGMIIGMVILTPPISWIWDKVSQKISKLKIRKNGSTKN